MRDSTIETLMKPFALVAALVMLATPAFARPSLTLEQQRRLERGDVVLLNVLPPGGDARGGQGGTGMALVHASADAVWRVLVDYQHHTGIYPRVLDSRVLERDDTRALVRYVVGVGPFAFGFHVNNFPEPARGRLEWRLAGDRRNDLFRDSWGYWQIDPVQHGVVLTYAMAARTVLPAFVTRGAERDGLVETLRAVRDRAEGGG
jgi:ribosome-associated toxin RatA of RatAB toxin-antitoxin module